jgi:putative nucleotidyltransferase with HDIG domain
MQVETLKESETLMNQDLGHLKVMVVDDEATICDTLRQFLQSLGIRDVQTAVNGQEALAFINQGLYDYVFLDLMMPEIHGMEILQKINGAHQLTSVIIMTGYPTMDAVISAMHNGASDFLVKPFRFQDVKLSLERIQRLRDLMKRNWLLSQELEKKKEVEQLNQELRKRIRHQTILYNIVDSLSQINRSENLYHHVVKQSLESCSAEKACFLIYDQGEHSLLALAQHGLEGVSAGTQFILEQKQDGPSTLDQSFIKACFGKPTTTAISLEHTVRDNGLIAVPFKIRKEPFGVLLVAGKAGEKGFDEEDEFILNFIAEKAALNIENIALYDNLKQSLIASLMSLVSAIEAKDAYTQQHSSRVTEYAIDIASEMGCPQDDLERLESSAPLHDIGKIGVSDGILNKPDRLNEAEYAQIKSHPVIGENIVAPLGLDREELAIIRNHHERWDGGGYPDGLKKEETPLLARVLAVADAFDAMSVNRTYRQALPLSKCLQELRGNSGSQFDPDVVNIAIPLLADHCRA